jgi:D-inositol-3-phosphate glycosyltransferase
MTPQRASVVLAANARLVFGVPSMVNASLDTEHSRTGGCESVERVRPTRIDAALFTGGIDPPYAFGLALALISNDICLEVIGSDSLDRPEMHATTGLTFVNVQPAPSTSGFVRRAWDVFVVYLKLIRYATNTKAKIFHILWNNKLWFVDRTVLMLYHKLLGKKIVFTAHNVNTRKRDGTDTWLNRFTLRSQYRLADHLFVHTDQMKTELIEDFGVRDGAVTVIPFGINNSVPDTSLTPREAKLRLGVGGGQKTLLFFGRIGPYKGLEFLATAFKTIAARDADYRLIVAGAPKKAGEAYLADIQRNLRDETDRGLVISKIQFIPDEDTEVYFKAADAVVLPYTQVYQSGVLFLAYSFGVPVIASDVGSFRADIVEGETGFLCRPGDGGDLANSIKTYFSSDLYKHLGARRQAIREYANARHSWEVVGEMTRDVYDSIVSKKPRFVNS